MDEVIMGGDINGEPNCGRKKERRIIQHGYCPRTDNTVCACYVCARVSQCVTTSDRKAQPSPSAYNINIIIVGRQR